MELKFSDLESDVLFTEAAQNSPVVRNWLLDRLMAYSSEQLVYTLHISVDSYTHTEMPSFDWSIWSCSPDDKDKPFGDQGAKMVIVGGLIHRGDTEYSSHT